MREPERSDLPAQNDQFRKLMITARKLRNLTQKEVAEKLGRHQSFVAKYEGGTRYLSVVEFMAITRVIGVDPRRIIAKLLRGWPAATSSPVRPPRRNILPARM